MSSIPLPPNQSGQSPVNGPHAGAAVGELHALAHYRILRPIGSGGMSEVYLAFDSEVRPQVAVKVLSDHLMNNPVFVNRFKREARLCRELSHPHIVKGFCAGRDSATGKLFMVMEYVDGPNAQERMDVEGPLPLGHAVRIVVDIARALEYLHHQRYVHRDIKPGNILIAPDGSAKLADLGVAKYLDNDAGLTTLDQSVGTPYYMPWEQGINAGFVDPRSDIFALGATFYHLVTGHVPFAGDDERVIARCKSRGIYLPASDHNPQLPFILDSILERMLARDPRKRFSSAGEVVEVLTASGMEKDHFSVIADLPMLLPQPLAPTRADLKLQSEVDTPLDTQEELIWRLKYRRRQDGSWRKMLAHTSDVIRLFEQGVLPDVVYAAREPSKIFRRLRAYPEFHKLESKATPVAKTKKKVNRLRKTPRTSSRKDRNWCNIFRGLCLSTALLLMLGALTILVHWIACKI